MDFTDRVITKSQNLLIVSSEHLLQPFDSNLWTSMFLDLKKLPSASSNLASIGSMKEGHNDSPFDEFSLLRIELVSILNIFSER